MAITDIDVTTPQGSEDLSNGDNRIREFKVDVVNSFPNIDAAVTPTAAELNGLIIDQTPAEAAASITPRSKEYPPGCWLRHADRADIPDILSGATDARQMFQDALIVATWAEGNIGPYSERDVWGPDGDYELSGNLYMLFDGTNNPTARSAQAYYGNITLRGSTRAARRNLNTGNQPQGVTLNFAAGTGLVMTQLYPSGWADGPTSGSAQWARNVWLKDITLAGGGSGTVCVMIGTQENSGLDNVFVYAPTAGTGLDTSDSFFFTVRNSFIYANNNGATGWKHAPTQTAGGSVNVENTNVQGFAVCCAFGTAWSGANEISVKTWNWYGGQIKGSSGAESIGLQIQQGVAQMTLNGVWFEEFEGAGARAVLVDNGGGMDVKGSGPSTVDPGSAGVTLADCHIAGSDTSAGRVFIQLGNSTAGEAGRYGNFTIRGGEQLATPNGVPLVYKYNSQLSGALLIENLAQTQTGNGRLVALDEDAAQYSPVYLRGMERVESIESRWVVDSSFVNKRQWVGNRSGMVSDWGNTLTADYANARDLPSVILSNAQDGDTFLVNLPTDADRVVIGQQCRVGHKRDGTAGTGVTFTFDAGTGNLINGAQTYTFNTDDKETGFDIEVEELYSWVLICRERAPATPQVVWDCYRVSGRTIDPSP